MRGVAIKEILLGALVAAVVLVPTASAKTSHPVRLAVVVLPKPALGKAGRSLALARGSGVVSNKNAPLNSITGDASTFAKLGRVTGYALTYGDRYSGRVGVTQITTGVDEFKNSADARRGLAFWKKDDSKITLLKPYGLAVAVKTVKAPRVGTHRFAEGTTLTVPNAAPVAFVDERFTDGRYVLDVGVAAESLSAAAGTAAKLARTLDHRLRLAEAGHLRGRPVKLPPPLAPGAPKGGPDLATLTLMTSDLGTPATLEDHIYATPSPPALSAYEIDWNPAGTLNQLSQLIAWFPTTNDATVLTRFEEAVIAHSLANLAGVGVGQFTPVDLAAVGDNASGGVVSMTQAGQPTIYLAVVALSSGQASDLILAGSGSPIQASDVVNLAQTAANRLDAGLSG
jgi:hypothetical protein